MPRWLKTNENEEAVATLEFVAKALDDVDTDPSAWRWVIIGLHIATQGFMVVGLRDSARLYPLRDDVADAWLKAHRNGTDPPREKLDSFTGLYKKVKRKRLAKFLKANAFKPVGSQDESIKKLASLRNKFVHFLPMSWSLEVSGLPKICADVLDFVEFLATSYRVDIWRDQRSRSRIELSLSKCRTLLDP